MSNDTTPSLKKNTLWVLLKEYNDYDQHGAYFECAWLTKPSVDQLRQAGVPSQDLGHVFLGGGRRYDEYEWYLLVEKEEGEAA